MMAQFVKAKKDISLTKCIDSKWDMQSSLYLTELEEKTLDGKIRWNKDWDAIGNGIYTKYLALYKNSNGMKVILNLREDESDGITLEALYTNSGKRIQKFFDEWSYQNELTDLLSAVNKSRGTPKTYDNISKLTNPYYDYNYNKKTTSTPIKTRVLTARGKKNEKILNEIHWEYNCEILGE